MEDKSVKIYPRGDGFSSVDFKMSAVLIERVLTEVESVSGKNVGLDFSFFMNNAVIEFIESDSWQRVKKSMQKDNSEG